MRTMHHVKKNVSNYSDPFTGASVAASTATCESLGKVTLFTVFAGFNANE
jgi:hypothetical protein